MITLFLSILSCLLFIIWYIYYEKKLAERLLKLNFKVLKITLKNKKEQYVICSLDKHNNPVLLRNEKKLKLVFMLPIHRYMISQKLLEIYELHDMYFSTKKECEDALKIFKENIYNCIRDNYKIIKKEVQ